MLGVNGSGAEIAEDLHLAGRRVHMFTRPCGRLVRGQGLSGRGIGAPIDVGSLVRQGMRLYGALLDIEGGQRMIAPPGLYLAQAHSLVILTLWWRHAGRNGRNPQ